MGGSIVLRNLSLLVPAHNSFCFFALIFCLVLDFTVRYLDRATKSADCENGLRFWMWWFHFLPQRDSLVIKLCICVSQNLLFITGNLMGIRFWDSLTFRPLPEKLKTAELYAVLLWRGLCNHLLRPNIQIQILQPRSRLLSKLISFYYLRDEVVRIWRKIKPLTLYWPFAYSVLRTFIIDCVLTLNVRRKFMLVTQSHSQLRQLEEERICEREWSLGS